MQSILVSELRGRRVITIDGGALAGEVLDVFVDGQNLRVPILLLRADRGEVSLPLEKVKSVGPDAVMIQTISATQALGESGLPESYRRFDALAKLEVLNVEGQGMGNLGDLCFAFPEGAIVEVVVKKGGVFGIGEQRTSVPAIEIRSIGTSAVTLNLGEDSSAV